MSGFMIVFLFPARSGSLRSRGSGFPLRLLSHSKVVPGCTFCAADAARSARVVAGSLTGVVLLALDFVGG
jgi:hypothetical protein